VLVAGAGTVGVDHGNRDINLPAESALSFKLSSRLNTSLARQIEDPRG
jgi:hypothetical protein